MIKLKFNILKEDGEDIALFGLGLNKAITSNLDNVILLEDNKTKLINVANKLSKMDGGHNKFLESIVVWIDAKLPEYVWSQFDTYRIGISKQSESKMHTLMKDQLTQDDFEDDIDSELLIKLNILITNNEFDSLIKLLPMSFLQRRIITTNYKTLRSIYLQRKHHKLKQWTYICNNIITQLKRPQWIE